MSLALAVQAKRVKIIIFILRAFSSKLQHLELMRMRID